MLIPDSGATGTRREMERRYRKLGTGKNAPPAGVFFVATVALLWMLFPPAQDHEKSQPEVRSR